MANENVTLFSIVEGDGEVDAVPSLLKRMLNVPYIHPDRPWRLRRNLFLDRQDERRIFFEKIRREAQDATPSGVLILFDAENKCCKDFLNSDTGQKIRDYIADVLTGIPYLFVLAEKGYESWLVAGLGGDTKGQNNPVQWLNENKNKAGLNQKYKKRIDQEKVTSNKNFDVDRAAENNPSFRRLRERITTMATQLLDAPQEQS